MPAPTILIGLGGLGSSIVQAVHARVPKQYKDLVHVHILDTDAAELKDSRYSSLDPDQITQTSDSITVGTCLSRLKNDTSVDTWFPAMESGSASVLHKPMPPGAAQFRAISRLAVLDALAHNRLDDFTRTLMDSVKATGSKFKEAVRVMIVNSIAGGTGSGSALQIALFVRDYFERVLRTENIVIRGIMVMPEVFVQNGDYKGADLMDNVRANGYAAIKEFDALTRIRAGRLEGDLAPVHPLELEYRLGQKTSATIEKGPAPFDFVFLYDYVNSQGENLGAKENYINQATEALYLQLFSPLEAKGGIYSQEDNLLLSFVKSGDRARYASSGIAKLIYPYQDVVDYCALKWATTGLSDDWLELDRLIDDELKQNEQDRRMGVHRKKPERHVRFVELMQQKAEAANALPFFRFVYLDAHLLDEDGHRVDAKSTAWLDEINKRIDESFKQANAQSVTKLEAFDAESLKDKDQVESQVERYERGLDNYRDSIAKATQPLANLIVREALWEDYRQEVDFTPGQDLRLNTWILGRNQATHPVAVRYLLSDMRIALETRLQELESELDRLERGIEGYRNRWDDSSTDEIETAGIIAGRLAQSGWLKHMVHKPLHGFAEEYQAAYDTQRNSIAKWAGKRLEQSVYGLLRQHISDMLKDWEGFFAQLEDVQESCERDIRLLARKHDDNIDPAKIYVCASEADKARLWEDECAAMRAEEIPENVSRQIYVSLYKRRAKSHFDEYAGRTSGWEEALFREHVVGWCRDAMTRHAPIDLDIKSAIDKELRHAQAAGKRTHESEEDAFRNYADKLNHLAYPCIQASNQNFEFWCLNSAVAESIGQKLLDDTIGNVNLDGQIRHGGARTDQVAYPKQELTFVRLTYGISATDLSSMTDPHGIYRQSYDMRIASARANPPTSYTPHLDWRWDSPAFLPEVEDEAQRKAMLDLKRATLYNLSRNAPYIVANDDGVNRWERIGRDGNRDVLTGTSGRPVAPTVQGLYEGLAVHYARVGEILAIASQQETASKAHPEALPLINSLSPLLDRLMLDPLNARSKADGEALATSLLRALFLEIIDIYQRCGEKSNAARDKARSAIDTAMAASDVMQNPANHGLDASWRDHVLRLKDAVLAPVA
jgi:hypothetical protein